MTSYTTPVTTSTSYVSFICIIGTYFQIDL